MRFLNEMRPAVMVKKNGSRAEALTDNYIKVALNEVPAVEVRQLVEVRIKKVTPLEVTGEVV
jgi:tRNA A37 methylthiotransferase MiaB